jgi:hypothetical protein
VIVTVLVVVVIGVVLGFLLIGATQPAYYCDSQLQPAAAATPAPDGSPAPLGQVTSDLGRNHVNVGDKVHYGFCPPTSGRHYNDPPNGPIPDRFFSKDDATVPQGWVHNLEHGHTVILYRCPEGCDETTQSALRDLQQSLPPSPICGFLPGESVVVTRFDDMARPFAAITWDRVLFLDTLDAAAVRTFREQTADRSPEQQCTAPTPTPAPATETPAATATPTPAAPSATATPPATATPAPAAPATTPAP